MSPADRRIQELIEKWRGSVDLHLQYVELSDAAYARAQAWPKHDRPTRWVLEVAQQKLVELQRHCATRQAMGDSQFAEALELMAFLANLVGIQHIQRFIPLAEPSKQTGGTGDAAVAPATPAPTGATSITRTLEAPTLVRTARIRSGDDTTREMPRLRTPAASPTPHTPASAPTATANKVTTAVAGTTPSATGRGAAPLGSKSAVAEPAKGAINTAAKQDTVRVPAGARTGSAQRAAAVPKPEPKNTPRPAARPGNAEPAAKTSGADSKGVGPDQKNKIISDAVRLLKWGKPWHELAELIGRMADRPPAAEIRKLLRTHKADIEARAKTK